MAHQVQYQTIAEVELEINPWPRLRRIQRAQIDESRRPVVGHGLDAVAPCIEQTALAIETRGTDRFALAEGIDAQVAAVKLRQQGAPLVPASPGSLAFL